MTRVGLYLDLRNPPGSGRTTADVYARTLERVAAAEARGLEAVWLTEHHGFADGYLPAPLTAAAAIAARTTRVRIGTAVVIAALTSPQALAEQAAVVDVLSGGRLELGLGAGWRRAEFADDAAFAARYDTLEATLRALPELWAAGHATPAPMQDPLPTWVGARGPRGARLAGRVDAGLLWLDPALMAPYLAGGPTTPRVGGLVNVFLADDPDAARERLRASGRRNRSTYRGNSEATSEAESETKSDTTFPKLQVLTGEQAIAAVRERVDGLPASDVFCFADLGALPDDLVDRHVELVCDVLRPGLQGVAA